MKILKIVASVLQFFGRQQQGKEVIGSTSLPINFQSHGIQNRIDPTQTRQVDNNLVGAHGFNQPLRQSGRRIREVGGSAVKTGFCGFPIDMLLVDDPFEQIEMTCDEAASTVGQCQDNFFFSTYQCEWINARCTSDADATGEDSECPHITTKTACEIKNWSGPRRCIWYAFSDRVPPPVPEWESSDGAYCGYPIDFIDGTDDPFAKPRQPCRVTAETKEMCTNSTFLAVYECSWKNGRCTSQAVSTNEDISCPRKQSQILCDGSSWVGSRACVWYDEEGPPPEPKSSPLPFQNPSSRPSLGTSSKNPSTAPTSILTPTNSPLRQEHMDKLQTTTPTNSPLRYQEPTDKHQTTTSRPTPAKLTHYPMPINTPLKQQPPPNKSSAHPDTKPPSLSPSDFKRRTSSPFPTPASYPKPVLDGSQNVISPTQGSNFSNRTMPFQETRTSLQPSANPTLLHKPSPTSSRIQISLPPTIGGDDMVTACQCDTSLRNCIDEPVKAEQSLYICLSMLSHQNDNTESPSTTGAEFVNVRDMAIIQNNGEFSDTVIRRSTSTNLETFVNIEKKHASIRTELRPDFFRDDTPNEVIVEGVIIIALGGNSRDYDLHQNSDGNKKNIDNDYDYESHSVRTPRSTTTINGGFQIQVSLVQTDEDFRKEGHEPTAWSWKELAVISGFVAAVISVFLLIRFMISKCNNFNIAAAGGLCLHR
mmetsp:Transcript_8696/g.12400  ORF Transcript_8696/g.12400 Transcript_8696/m.12400 type:complete len:704 (+) Transcript_8696:1438-3549(+)